jgi:hypothetical protein
MGWAWVEALHRGQKFQSGNLLGKLTGRKGVARETGETGE